MRRFVCIHGHFYQPPRENPWIDSIETQDSAAPFHDWNDRITNECYGPNAAARILDLNGDVSFIQNNYSKISFNFGPTLLSWLENHRPTIYRSILEADRISLKRFNGHGSALAQVYNHVIMPLANRRDKQTQIEWGVQDFEYRFSRKPEGIWLAETAVDQETLELLLDAGIRFTILAPRQASHIRYLNEGEWQDVGHSRIDPRYPYLCKLPSGREITLFFYDGNIAQDVAFSGLLKNGEDFANRLLRSLDESPEKPQLAHIATDGESYGHHHRYGEMALAYALLHLEKQHHSTLTIYGEFLDHSPPQFEVKIFENSSWSCVHGVERWQSDCGCCTGGNSGWNQKWRGPLRQGLNALRDQLSVLFEEQTSIFFNDPWGTRNRYIAVNLQKITAADFVRSEATRPLTDLEIQKVIHFLEMQHLSLLMFTSCGWFFDEISGIEPVQILQYASRAIQIAEETTGKCFEGILLNKLRSAPSNLVQYLNGETIYQTLVKPNQLDLPRIAAHIVTHSMIEQSIPANWYQYQISPKIWLTKTIEKTELRFGRMTLRSISNQCDFDFIFFIVHLGDHNLTLGIHPFTTLSQYDTLENQWKHLSDQGDVIQLMRTIDYDFTKNIYTLTSLLRDTQSLLLNHALKNTFEKIEETFESIYRENHVLLNILKKSSFATPPVINTTIDLLYNAKLQKSLQMSPFNAHEVHLILDEFMHWNPTLDLQKTQYLICKKLSELLTQWSLSIDHSDLLYQSNHLLTIVERLHLKIDFWEIQHWAYRFRTDQGAQIPAVSLDQFDLFLKQLKIAPITL